MIDTRTDAEVARDHAQAEHDAVDAEQRAEREAEAAHEQVRESLIEALRDLAEQQQAQALRLVTEGTLPTIRARGVLGSSHLRYVHRASEVAHLAGRAALTIERFGGYALGAQVEALLLAHTGSASQQTAGDARAAYEVALYAARQVRDAARKALAGTREAAGLSGTNLVGSSL